MIDETSLIGNRNYASLINLISEHKARAVLTGDLSQHQAIEAGKPSALLLNSGKIATAFMDDIVRQKASDYRKAVETLVAGKHEQALHMLAALPVERVERNDIKNIYAALKSSVVEVVD